MDNAGGPSRSDQLDLMLTYEQQAHARTKAALATAQAERDAERDARHANEQAVIAERERGNSWQADFIRAEAERDAARQEAAAAQHHLDIIEPHTQRGITDCSTPLFIRVQNMAEELAKSDAALARLQRERNAEAENGRLMQDRLQRLIDAQQRLRQEADRG